MRAKELEL
ncbi:unnamed protein product, partial [Allacma fusca]